MSENNYTNDWSTSDYNTGNYNTNNRNTGNWNTGNWNTGDYNKGNRNTGDRNTGDRNTGVRNTGGRNTGNFNAGSWNTGNFNTGNFNTGNYNAGDYNTGDFNTGKYNTGNFNAGFFNTKKQPIYIFNQIAEDFKYEDFNAFLDVKLTEWILPEKMTAEEKFNNPDWETCEGYLKEREYKEACILAWSEAPQEAKNIFLNLPNFDSDIFKEITGIDTKVKEKTINIDGIEYTISEIKKALKK